MAGFYFGQISFRTRGREDVVVLTQRVEEEVRRSGLSNGIVLVYAPHATGVLIANEAEPGLISDIVAMLKRVNPPDGKYEHNRIDDNAHAHLSSVLAGHFLVFPLVNGRLVRGTWQEIMFVELDGPRDRRVYVTVLGE